MTRTIFAAIAIVASAGLATPLVAQASMQKKNQSKETTITGCVAQGPSGGFQLTNVESRSTAPKGTSGSNMSESNSTWDLKNGTNLDRHLGHKVQVTGYPDTRSSAQPKGTTGSSEPQTHNFDVRSVKMISSTCP